MHYRAAELDDSTCRYGGGISTHEGFSCDAMEAAGARRTVYMGNTEHEDSKEDASKIWISVV